MASSSRKRSRPSSTNEVVAELPDIPGVPMEVLPAFLEAIRVGTKFYAKCRSVHVQALIESPLNNSNNHRNSAEETSATTDFNQAGNSTVLGAVFSRMQAATANTTNPASDPHEQRKEAMNQAMQQWLAIVQHIMRRKPTRSQPKNDADGSSSSKKNHLSVAYACFLYVWELQQQHGRLAVRRAALAMTAQLCQKSKDCRWHLGQDDHLDQWISQGLLQAPASKHPQDTICWQTEAYQWLSSLVQQGYGQLYPKILVAAQRLRQHCPQLLMESNEEEPKTSSTARQPDPPTQAFSMVDWRRLRDIALEHGAQEQKQVQKWIDRAHQALEVLVPRLGEEPNQTQTPETDRETKMPPTEDDDEDEIDWEDGEEENDFDDGTSLMKPDFEHLSAVERTLQAMASAGGLKGGALEIDLQKEKEEEEEVVVDSQAHQQALAKLQRCVEVLGRTHTPRLAAWLEGLHHADHLTIPDGQATLVALSSQMAKRRRYWIEELKRLQAQVASILTSASELGMPTQEAAPTDDTAAPEEEPTFRSLGLVNATVARNRTEGRANLTTALQRKKRRPKRSSARSQRIQIKFRST